MIRAFGRTVLLAALVAVLAVTGAACGDSGDESTTPKETTYTNAQYGFEITYGEPLSQVKASPSLDEKYAIAFSDKEGPLIDDQYVNGVRVSVIELGRSVTAADVTKSKDELERVVKRSVAETGGKLTSQLKTIEINGVPGFTVNYETTQGGEQLTCRLTALFKDKRQYTLNEQAVSSDWASMESTLHQVVLSFKTF